MAKQAGSSGAKRRDPSGDIVFGHNLRQFRTERQLTLEQLAKMVGQSKGALSHFENGQTSPKLETLRRLGEALGTGVDALLYGAGNKYRKPAGSSVDERVAALPDAVRHFTAKYLEDTSPGFKKK